MKSPNTQATAIASMLTALGATPVKDETQTCVRIEAEVPLTLGEAARVEFLHFLLRASDRFGHSLNKDGTSVIWAEVDNDDTQDDRGES